VRAYDPSDLAEVNAWHRARGMRELKPECVPRFGLIEPGLAAGFLYVTDSRIVFADGLVSNPEAPAKARGRAALAVARSLVALGRQTGSTVIAMTALREMDRRLGGVVLGERTLLAWE
jgi:hypothetical protein